MRIKEEYFGPRRSLYTNSGTRFDDWIMQLNLRMNPTPHKNYLHTGNFRFKI